MKILFVLPRMVTGGVERVTLRLVAGLQARGHECALISSPAGRWGLWSVYF